MNLNTNESVSGGVHDNWLELFFLQKNDSPTDNFAWKDQIASLNGMLV